MVPKQETKRNENSIYQCRHCLPECQPKSSFSNKHDLQPTPNQRKAKRVNNQKGNEREPRKDTPTALTIAGHGSSNMRAATISTAPEKYCSTEVTSLSCTGTPFTSQSIDVIIEKWKSHKLLGFPFFFLHFYLFTLRLQHFTSSLSNTPLYLRKQRLFGYVQALDATWPALPAPVHPRVARRNRKKHF